MLWHFLSESPCFPRQFGWVEAQDPICWTNPTGPVGWISRSKLRLARSDWAIVGLKRVWAVITFFLLNQTLHVSWCGSFVFSCQSFRCRSLPLFICWRFDVSRARDHTYDLCSSRIAFTPFLLFPLSLLVLYVCSVPRPMSQRISTSSLVQRWLPYHVELLIFCTM